MDYGVYTINGEEDCVVCDDKWKTKTPPKHSTGAKEIPLISTMSLLTLNNNRVSINFCSLHLRTNSAYVKTARDSIHVRNINTMNIHKRVLIFYGIPNYFTEKSIIIQIKENEK